MNGFHCIKIVFHDHPAPPDLKLKQGFQHSGPKNRCYPREKNMALFKTSNPALNGKTFENLPGARYGGFDR